MTREEEQLHSDLEIVKKELFRSEQLVVKLREHAIRDREKIATCTDEINELKKSIDHLNLASADKDTQLNQVSIQLHAKEEHMGHLYEKLNRQAEKIRFMEEYAKISSDDNARLLQIRNKQHEKNIQLDWEISQLKDNVKELNDYIVRNRQQAAKVLGFEVGNYSLCQEYQNSQPLTQPQGNLESPVAYLEPLNGHFVQQQQQHSNLGSHQPQQRHQ
ncbi:golgin subfamily A member 6-like protein 7 [Drosophila obscura]|uniref:golgin subfamily A member 6-like protein 7 n=1 Tax=Drosophila obscura TaxID=7282 RepID=UPI001BB20369|nr:golgin subfamily A member 6-like protein 7 [Drosophila obscura]